MQVWTDASCELKILGVKNLDSQKSNNYCYTLKNKQIADKSLEITLTGHDVCGCTAFNTSFSSGSFLVLTFSLEQVENSITII